MSEEHTERLSDAANKPFMLGYVVKPIGDGKKSIWNKIGAAWAHSDGEGYDVRLDALPVDGRLVLRTVPTDHQNQGEKIDRTP